MATGDFSGNLAVWDLETMKQEKSVNAHSDVLTCISSSKSFSNILTGKVFLCFKLFLVTMDGYLGHFSRIVLS